MPTVANRDTRIDAQHDGARSGRFIGAIVVAVLAFGLAGWFTIKAIRGPKFATLEVSSLPIPVKDSKRLGEEAILILSSDAWLSQPAAQKDADLDQSLRTLAPSGVRVIVVKDVNGAPRVTAQLSGDEVKSQTLR